jgi:purine-nucleoside phosphorylase
MIPSPDLGGLLDQAVAAVRLRHQPAPLIGVVLGSGLGAFGDTLDQLVKIPYADIPDMPTSRVVGHAGNLCMGSLQGVQVACMQGRVHLYEGHEPERVVFGVRLLARLGCKAVLLTNAAGGVHPSLQAGDLMLIVDHINLTGRNPLHGPNHDSMGERFPDMSQAYDPKLGEAARLAATQTGVSLKEGVYLANLGPSYETPAEIRMARTMGADAVGMSTVPEVIALRHMRVRTAAISCITNLAAGISPTPLNHAEVEQTAKRTRNAFVKLLSRWVQLTAAEVGS